MKIVIDIPEEMYKHILSMQFFVPSSRSGKSFLNEILKAIRMGTPLPKGHGRLKDVDDIALIDEQFYVPSDYYVAESAINDAPTIIEADKESEGE